MNEPRDASVFETDDEELPTLTPAQIWRSLGAVIASVFAASLTFSICMPLLVLILERRETEPWLIGLNTAATPAGLLLFTLIMPRIVERLGTMRALYLGFILMILSVVLLPVFDNIWAWFPIRFLMGVGIAIHWVVSETWINTLVDNRIRGRVMSIYVTAMSAGFLGALPILLIVGSEGPEPFFIIAAALAIGVMPLILARDLAPHIKAHTGFGIFAAIRRAPATMLAALTDGFVFAAIFSFFLIYVQREGYTEQGALTLLIVLSVGNVCLQYPVGMIADKYDRRVLLIIFAMLIAVFTAVFPFTLGDPFLSWPLLFLWGGVLGGIYTCGLALVGQRFSRKELAPANATFIFVYELGHLTGPPIAGFAIALWDPHGLIVLAVSAGVVFALFATIRHVSQRGKDSA